MTATERITIAAERLTTAAERVVAVASDAADSLAATLPAAMTLARVGLAVMLVAAGGHKLLQPGDWTVYVPD